MFGLAFANVGMGITDQIMFLNMNYSGILFLAQYLLALYILMGLGVDFWQKSLVV